MSRQTYATAKALFLDVLSRTPPERLRYLAQASQGNSALQHEVESLLGWHEGPPRDVVGPPPGRSRLRRRWSGSAAAVLPGETLPKDVIEQTCRRVRTVSLAFAAVWATMTVVNNFVLDVIADPQLSFYPEPGNQVGAVGVLLSLAMAHVAGRHADSPRFVIAAGDGYLVAVCLLIAILSQWAPPPPGPRISWICVPLLFYPAVVPNAPGRTLWTSMTAASMEPLVFAFTQAASTVDMNDPRYPVWSFLPNYICACLSLVPAGVIQRLGQQVSHARALGNYRLEERLGQGGMGDVYRASHTMLARPAAVKLIRADVLASHGAGGAGIALARFRREAEAAALLRSPHTIDLYDFGVSQDGTPFLVMELLDGLDLETLVRRFGPLPPARAVHLLIQICESLEEAHVRGLVHRDIKPSNIFTCRMGHSVDFIKVLDFGLVKSVGAASAKLTPLTAQLLAFGTPAYLAPEAVRGDRTADHLVDIYALGCVAYWMLTGQLVFAGATPMALMLEHVNTPPPAPSACAPTPVPGPLDDAILACLAKDPARRPQSARDLARRLAAIRGGGAWSADDAERWWEEHGFRAPASSSASAEADRQPPG